MPGEVRAMRYEARIDVARERGLTRLVARQTVVFNPKRRVTFSRRGAAQYTWTQQSKQRSQ